MRPLEPFDIRSSHWVVAFTLPTLLFPRKGIGDFIDVHNAYLVAENPGNPVLDGRNELYFRRLTCFTVASTSVDLEVGWKRSQSGKHAHSIDCRRQQIGRYSEEIRWVQNVGRNSISLVRRGADGLVGNQQLTKAGKTRVCGSRVLSL